MNLVKLRSRIGRSVTWRLSKITETSARSVVSAGAAPLIVICSLTSPGCKTTFASDAVSTLITCAAPEYLARAGTPRKPGDLTGHKCLVYGEGAAHEGWEFACRGKRQRIKVARSLQCNQIRMLREAALGGGGIVMQPSFNVWSDLAAGRLVPVLDDWTAGALNIFLVYSSRRFLPAKTRLFIDYLTARFPGGPDHDPWLARAVPRRPGPGARGSAVRPRSTSRILRNWIFAGPLPECS